MMTLRPLLGRRGNMLFLAALAEATTHVPQDGASLMDVWRLQHELQLHWSFCWCKVNFIHQNIFYISIFDSPYLTLTTSASQRLPRPPQRLIQMQVRHRAKLTLTPLNQNDPWEVRSWRHWCYVRVFFSLWLKQKSGTGIKRFKTCKIKPVPVLCHKRHLADFPPNPNLWWTTYDASEAAELLRICFMYDLSQMSELVARHVKNCSFELPDERFIHFLLFSVTMDESVLCCLIMTCLDCQFWLFG